MNSTSHIYIIPKPSYGVVICMHHQYALQPARVVEHFASKHANDVTKQERADIQAYVDSQMVHLHQNMQDVPIPTEPCPPVVNLKLHRGSLKCVHCCHITVGASALGNMKKHVRSHGISASKTTVGADRAAKWSENWRSISSQQFFERASTATLATKHFEVCGPDQVADAATAPEYTTDDAIDPSLTAGRNVMHRDATLPPSHTRTLDALEAQLKAAHERSVGERLLLSRQVPTTASRQTNPYLEHTQFQKCLAGLEWDQIRSYLMVAGSLPLQFIRDNVKSMTLVYQHVTACTPRWARIQVMQEHLQHIPIAPLIPYLEFNNKHSHTIVQIFTFFYHVFSNNVPCPSTLRISEQQRHTWTAIIADLNSLGPGYPAVDVAHKRTQLSPFEAKCHQFWVSLIEQTSMDSDFELSIITPLAFIAVDPKANQFREAYNFATDCSAIKKYARMAGCYQYYGNSALDCTALQTLDTHIKGNNAITSVAINGYTNAIQPTNIDFGQGTKKEREIEEEDDQDEDMKQDAETQSVFIASYTSLLEASRLIAQQDKAKADHAASETEARTKNLDFKTWVHHYLTTEFSTSIGWVTTTAHYIARFRYSHTLDAFVRWNGSSVTVRHLTTSLEQYTRMVWELVDKAKSILFELTFVQRATDLPDIPWEKMTCNPADATPGYTPFSARNPALASGEMFVLQQMIGTMRSQRRCALSINDLGNFDQVQRYCVKVQEFLDVLFLLVHFTSGQPGRLTEVLSVQVENTVDNGIRNLFMFNGLVAIVPRYHKGYNRDKSLKIIYRFLPREIGRLFVWYAWLVKPFYSSITVDKDMSAHYQARSPFLWSNRRGEQYSSSLRFSKRLEEATLLHLGQKVGASIMRHLLIAFGRSQHEEKRGKVVALTPEEAEEELDEQERDVTERQSGHTTLTGTGVYAVATALQFRSPSGDAQAFFRISEQWHRDLGFSKSAHDVLVSPDAMIQYPMKKDAINVKQVLRANFGRQAQFRGQQRAVIEAVLCGEAVVSYVAGTGSGKSLAFLLPALCDGYGQTAVITPLVSLRTDLISRCKEHWISSSVWGTADFNETSQIIFAMPEHLGNKSFISLISRLRDTRRLERIVVDEFHYILLPDHEYRPHLLKIRDIGHHAVALTLLSATVPQARESEAFRLIGVEDTVRKFREPTNRTNIQYSVVDLCLSAATVEEDMADFAARQLATYAKIIAYVATTDLAIGLSQKLKCLCYHGKLDDGRRGEIQQEFAGSKGGILVATTAFNAGVDIPNIDLVMRFGLPDHPILWSQEGGRAGRDGRRSAVQIVLGPGIPTFYGKLTGLEKAVIDEIVQRGRSGSKCMRAPIEDYFDGNHARVSCQDHESQCGACLRRSAPGLPPTPGEGSAKSRSRVDILATPEPRKRVSVSGGDPRDSTLSGRYMLSSPPTPPVPRAGAWGSWPDSTPTDRRASSRTVDSTPTLPMTPFNAIRLYSPQSMDQDGSPEAGKRGMSNLEAALESSPLSRNDGAKRARVDRALQWNRNAVVDRNRGRARFEQVELKQTGEWWNSHCVQCFTDNAAFDHPRADCEKKLGQLVSEYRRNRIHGKFVSGTCYFCALPVTACTKWMDPETGQQLNRPVGHPDCTYPRAFIDTWACLWENSPSMREQWLERIRGESSGQTDGESPEGFAKYFQGGVQIGSGRPFCRITYDVNWLTHKFFLKQTSESGDVDKHVQQV